MAILLCNEQTENVMKSFIPREEDIQRRWHLIDAEGQILGRLATRVATLLSGKDKAIYTPFLDTGDYVIIINVDKIRLSGNKAKDKMYRHHTGYPGGLRETSAGVLLSKNPSKLVREAVHGMLP
jgi:large subunit ribosomal protein L13